MRIFTSAMTLAVALLLFGCINPELCVRCRSTKLSSSSNAPVHVTKQPDLPSASNPSTVQDPAKSEKGREDKLAEAIDNVGYLVFYVIVASLSAWVLQKTGREDTLLARISAGIYDSCSSTKKAILRVVNVLLLDRLFKHKGKQ